MTVAEEYARYVNGLRFVSLSSEVVSMAKTLILDTIGVALAGISSDTRKVIGMIIPTKFVTLTKPVIGSDSAHFLIETVENMESMENISDLWSIMKFKESEMR